MHDGLALVASGPSADLETHAAILFEPVTPEQFFAWTSDFFGPGQPFSATIEAGIAEPLEAALQHRGWRLAGEEPALALAQIPAAFPSPPAELVIATVH